MKVYRVTGGGVATETPADDEADAIARVTELLTRACVTLPTTLKAKLVREDAEA